MTEEKKEVGRPSKYTEEMPERALAWLEEHKDTHDEVKGFKVNFPTVESLAVELGVNKTTLYEWEKKHPEFSNALGKIKAEQHKRLVSMGLAGKYNPTITKLVLMSNHEYSEKQATTNMNITPADLKDMSDEDLAKLAGAGSS